MNTVLSGIMYILWVLTIILVLATTFTDFQYEDLNAFAAVFLVFALLNTFLVVARSKKKK